MTTQDCATYIVNKLIEKTTQERFIGVATYHSYSIPEEIAEEAARQLKEKGWYVFKTTHSNGHITALSIFDSPQRDRFYPMESFTQL